MRWATVLQIVFRGVLWAVAYNAAWGLAWVGFMRHQWAQAATLSGRTMPWTPDFWMVWIPLTIPFGVAIAAYLSGAFRRERLLVVSVGASFVLWVPATFGMVFSMALTTEVIVPGSAVNLVALLLASFSVAWLVARRNRTLAHQPPSAAG